MPAADTSIHSARIRALDEAWLAAAANRDLDGMLAIYAPDAQELLPNMAPLVGRDSIREFYRELLERLPRFRHHFEPLEIFVAASGDLAVVRGTYEFIADTTRPDERQNGKFLGVWERKGGDWRLRYNISNPSP